MILLYHNVYPDAGVGERWSMGPVMTSNIFKRQIYWLAKHYQMISLNEYLAEIPKQGLNKRKLIALTFDDGFRYTFQCVSPFLRKNNIPATFFMSTGHLERGELLWFSYLNALCFEKLYMMVDVNGKKFPLQTLGHCRQTWQVLVAMAKTSGDPIYFSSMLAKSYPLPQEVMDMYAGMTHDQLMDAGKSDLLEVGAHTVTHPYLHLMSREIQEREIFDSKRVLAELTGRPIRYFAYPGGEYNHDTVEIVKAAGFEAAFAVIPKHVGIERQFEMGRVGIYSPSLFKLYLKMAGVIDFARWLGLRVG